MGDEKDIAEIRQPLDEQNAFHAKHGFAEITIGLEAER
jgi:hypothetical protein